MTDVPNPPSNLHDWSGKVVKTNQLSCIAAAWRHRSRSLICCTSSGSSAEVAALSRPADVSGGGHSDQSVRRCVDSAPGTLVVISGYWTGPDVDDGCGSIEAVLQRIV
ncbi:hypothetical protein PR202_gb21977 [Eleusine coracana subsp. coracana]|uniref:Uncharacterized protein n=1 Tax=Eleusine coracana subsp. coracana TaxID=191504 RepID=A0AAV5FEI2_ELECO|nr:hypothetical protein PR202_gb21977 [Eleusine coracana subsp. coracana]